MGRLDGRTPIVTGAGQGVGRGIALLFAAEGAHVVAASRTLERVEALAQEIKADGGSALAVECDVSHRDQIDGAVAAAVATFGPPDILVNNAQGAQHTRGP